jgi:hypothetical protein
LQILRGISVVDLFSNGKLHVLSPWLMDNGAHPVHRELRTGSMGSSPELALVAVPGHGNSLR